MRANKRNRIFILFLLIYKRLKLIQSPIANYNGNTISLLSCSLRCDKQFKITLIYQIRTRVLLLQRRGQNATFPLIYTKLEKPYKGKVIYYIGLLSKVRNFYFNIFQGDYSRNAYSKLRYPLYIISLRISAVYIINQTIRRVIIESVITLISNLLTLFK